MNNMYNWHDERMNELKMQEIKREVEYLYLLKEAEIAGPGLLSRAANALKNWLQARRQRARDRYTAPLAAYKTADDQSC